MESLFIQMMYKSQFRKIDPYDWICGPGSQMNFTVLCCMYVLIIVITIIGEQLCTNTEPTAKRNPNPCS